LSIGIGRSAAAQDPEGEGDIGTSTTEDTEIVRGLSWDMVGGGIPNAGSIIHGELGFSGLPRVSYHYTLAPDFSLGALVAFDYGNWVAKRAFHPSLIIAVPIRFALYRDDTMSIAVRGDPGIVFGFSPGVFAAQIEVGGVIAFQVEDRFVIGGGLDFPIMFGAQTGVESEDGTPNKFFLAMPILIGPVAEFHITPPLAITLDAKFGPAFRTSISPLFALKIHAGIAYRF
jgi:hypothetical protein